MDIALLVTASSYRTRTLLDAGGITPEHAAVSGYRFAYALSLVGVLVGLTLAATLLRNRPEERKAV